ncbi:MAG: hypothetical protein ACRDNS_30805 [Trebonia sp.]
MGRDPALGTRSRQALADWISGMAVIPGNDAVAVSRGRLSAAATLRGRPRPVNDMWVAACCLTYDLPPLATLSLKDYEDFRTHHGLRILGVD